MKLREMNITYNDKQYPKLVDLCTDLDLKVKYMRYYYITQGFTLEESIEKTRIRMDMCLTVNGIEFKSVREIVSHYGLNYKALNKLLDVGVPLEQCVNIIRENNKIHFEGEVYENLKDLANRKNMGYQLLYGRLKQGWTLTKSVNEPVKPRALRSLNYL